MNVIWFVALLSTALAMGAALAHALALPNKISLAADQYFIIQQIYAGWDMLAFLLLIEFASLIALAGNTEAVARRFILASIVCLIAAQAMFWMFTYPANVATRNWTTIPADWASLRIRWEYSHLAGAAFQVSCMAFLICATLVKGREGMARTG
jgi:hypothetical protein